MTKNTSITINKHFKEVIDKSIESGRYSSASEVIRAGLRLVEKEESKFQILRDAIKAGSKSGYIEDFNPKEHLAKLNKKHINDTLL